MSERNPTAEPLPIWFFVGLVLAAYGLLVLGSALLSDSRAPALSELKPGLWWGAIMVVAGVAFTAIGLKVHADGRREAQGGPR
jgi:di/tricarboxylate transporter